MRFQLKEGALELEGVNDTRLHSNVDIALTLQLSSAISLKRIADALEGMHKRRELTNICDQIARIAEAVNSPNDHGEVGSAAIAGALMRGLRDGR